MNRISINEVSTFRWNFFEDVVRYSTLGFHGIGVWRHKISDFCDHTVSETIQSAQLKVSSLQWVGGFTGSDGFSFAEALEDAVAAIRSASILHADCLIVHPGSNNGHTRSHALRLLNAAMLELIPVAQDFGVRLALEPMPLASCGAFTFLDQIRAALDFVSRFPRSHLGIVLDLYNFGCDPNLQFELIANLDRLALVQLADRRCGRHCEQNRCLPGEGSLPLASWIRVLEHSGYRGFYEFELFGEDVASIDGFQLLDELARRIPELFAPEPRLRPTECSPADVSADLSALGRS